MTPVPHDLSNAKVWDGTLLKDLVVPYADLCQRRAPFPFAINPYNDVVREASYKWAFETSSPSLAHQQKMIEENMASYMAYSYPEATMSQLRVLCDMNVWYCIFDDVCDDADKLGGEYSEECKTLDEVMIKHLQSLQNGASHEDIPNAILNHVGLKALSDIVGRFMENGFSKEQLVMFCGGIIKYIQSNQRIATHDLTLEEYVKERRYSIGGQPYTAILDWAFGFNLSPSLRQHPIVQELDTCLDDYIFISNDVHSLAKEVLKGSQTKNNTVCHLMKLHKTSVQDAMYEATDASLVALNDMDMLTQCIAECEVSEEDKALLYRYSDAAKKVVSGYMKWAHESSRYNVAGVPWTWVSPDTTSIDKYKLRPACQWLREKYILKKPTQETPPDRNPVPLKVVC